MFTRQLFCKRDNRSIEKALKDNKVESGSVHHSNRGVQYYSKEYTCILKRKKAVISMMENGSPYENAVAERVNGILKTELLQPRCKDFKAVTKAVDKAIEIYNKKRPHLSIGMLTQRRHTNRMESLRCCGRKK